MPCQTGYIEDANGNCVIDPNAQQSAQQITCWDGSLASTYDQCPDIGAAWDTATGIGILPDGELGTGVFGDDWVAPAWWDDPGTLNEDERAKYIYQMAGGESKTGMDFDTFWLKHETDFPGWEESGYAAKYENVLEQLGMLNTSIRLASEEFNLDLDSLSTRTQAHMETALTQKENIGGQMESQFIGTGGVVSGRAIEAAETTSENINQALGLEFRGIDIEKDLLEITYEGELVNIEGRKIDYENTLIDIEDSYEKHLLDLINTINIEKFDCADGEVLCPDGISCATTTEECGNGDGLVSCGHFGMITPAECDDLANEAVLLNTEFTVQCEDGTWAEKDFDCAAGGGTRVISICTEEDLRNGCKQSTGSYNPNALDPLGLGEVKTSFCDCQGYGKEKKKEMPIEFETNICNTSPECCTGGVWDDGKCGEKPSGTECSTADDCPECPEGSAPRCGNSGYCDCVGSNTFPNPFD